MSHVSNLLFDCYVEHVMTEAVQLALIVNTPILITAITGLVVVLRKLKKIETQTNGNLSDMKTKVETAEHILPGITGQHPPGAVIEARMSVNDPATPDPPKITQNSTRLEN